MKSLIKTFSLVIMLIIATSSFAQDNMHNSSGTNQDSSKFNRNIPPNKTNMQINQVDTMNQQDKSTNPNRNSGDSSDVTPKYNRSKNTPVTSPPDSLK